MIKYIPYTIVFIPFWFLSLLLAFILPCFSEERLGGINNDDHQGVEPKLPTWLSWFDTPDNSLFGDDAHKVRHPNYTGYWAQVCWLCRNALYGFRWSVISCPVTQEVIKRTDWLYTSGWYFQLYVTNHIKFGWILDAHYQRDNKAPNAIYIFWN